MLNLKWTDETRTLQIEEDGKITTYQHENLTDTDIWVEHKLNNGEVVDINIHAVEDEGINPYWSIYVHNVHNNETLDSEYPDYTAEIN